MRITLGGQTLNYFIHVVAAISASGWNCGRGHAVKTHPCLSHGQIPSDHRSFMRDSCCKLDSVIPGDTLLAPLFLTVPGFVSSEGFSDHR